MEKPVVSICIPAYEQPDLVARAVQSVFDQSLQDFEVVVTDDSRTDLVERVLLRWRDDPRFVYVRNVERLGSPENWNAALALARADLIKFLHHDDWFSDECSLDRFVRVMQDNPSATFAFSSAKACDIEGNVIYYHCPTCSQVDALRRFPLGLQFANIVGPPSSTIFRKSPDFKFDTALVWVVDIDAYLRLMGKWFCFIPEPLVCVSANAPHQITSQVANDTALRVAEHLYLYERHTPRGLLGRLRGVAFLVSLLSVCSASEFRAICTQRQAFACSAEERLVVAALHTWEVVGKFVRKASSFFRRLLPSHAVGSQSFSQCGEDMIVDFLLMWLGVGRVEYLDIGAHHPTWLSNTYRLYCAGNRGVLVEPDADLCRELQRVRPRDTVLNAAVGESGDGLVRMYVMSSRTLNTLDAGQAKALEASGDERIEMVREVRHLGINELLSEFFGAGKPNVVSLDVEGLDLLILKKWDFARFKPEVFCVETLTYTRNNTERKLTEIVDFMDAAGYMLYADTFVNSIFVCKKAWSERPCSAQKDGFSHD